jgi:hypothetical protein
MNIMSLLPLIVFFIIGSSIFIAVVIYKLIYKKNLNKALDGTKAISMVDPASFIQGFMLLVVVILSIVSVSSIQELKRQQADQQVELNTLRDKINSIQYSVGSIESQFSAYVASNAWIQSSSYLVIDYDPLNQLIDIQMMVSLKELHADAIVKIVAVSTTDFQDITEVVSVSNTLNFVANFTLNATMSYRFEVVASTQDELSKEAFRTINFVTLLQERFRFHMGFSLADNMETYDINVYNHSLGLESFQISGIVLRLYNGLTLIQTIDLLPNLSAQGNIQTFYHGSNQNTSTSTYSLLGLRYVLEVTDGFGTTLYETLGPSLR